MRNKKDRCRIIFIFVIAVLISKNAYSHSMSWHTAPFLNPGLKIGYDFGKKGGFFIGFEASAGVASEFMLAGVVVGFQSNFKQQAVVKYVEGEIGTAVLGLSLGRQWADYEKPKFRARLWGGAFGYLSLKVAPTSINPFELGLVGKLPLLLLADEGLYFSW